MRGGECLSPSQFAVLRFRQVQVQSAAACADGVLQGLFVLLHQLRWRTGYHLANLVRRTEVAHAANRSLQVRLKELDAPAVPVKERAVDPVKRRTAGTQTLTGVPGRDIERVTAAIAALAGFNLSRCRRPWATHWKLSVGEEKEKICTPMWDGQNTAAHYLSAWN